MPRPAGAQGEGGPGSASLQPPPSKALIGGGKLKPSKSQMSVARKCYTSWGLSIAIRVASGYHEKIKGA
jgi:hypothetical protein